MRRGSLLWHRKQIALRKLFALVLCFSFILTPVEMALAQDAGTGTAPTYSETTTPPPAPPPSPDFSIPGVDSTVPSTDGSTDAAALDAGTSPTSPVDSNQTTDSNLLPATDSTDEAKSTDTDKTDAKPDIQPKSLLSF